MRYQFAKETEIPNNRGLANEHSPQQPTNKQAGQMADKQNTEQNSSKSAGTQAPNTIPAYCLPVPVVVALALAVLLGDHPRYLMLVKHP